MQHNFKIIFALKTLKSISNIFVETFLVLYLLTLSEQNILPLGIYNLFYVTFTFLSIFLLRNINKTKRRIHILKIGILLDFIFFISIILLKENIITYIYVIGILYGLEEGWYYSAYNVIESNCVTNQERTKFIGYYQSLKSGISILFPIIFGSTMKPDQIETCLFLLFIIIILRMILAFHIKEPITSNQQKTSLKQYYQEVKQISSIKQVYKMSLYNGLTYSSGAFQSIITLYIIKVFQESFSLGLFTSIFSFISCILGILFAKFFKPKQYPNLIKISMTGTITTLIIMILKCNPFTIIIFNLCQTISKLLLQSINETSMTNLSNQTQIKNKYKVEYFLGTEIALFIGRFTSHAIFILIALIDIAYIIPICVLYLALLAHSSIQLQNQIEKEK